MDVTALQCNFPISESFDDANRRNTLVVRAIRLCELMSRVLTAFRIVSLRTILRSEDNATHRCDGLPRSQIVDAEDAVLNRTSEERCFGRSRPADRGILGAHPL